jgi:hypothetical protein
VEQARIAVAMQEEGAPMQEEGAYSIKKASTFEPPLPNEILFLRCSYRKLYLQIFL